MGHHAIEILEIIPFVHAQLLFSQPKFFQKNSAYMMSQELPSLDRILDTSELAMATVITRGKISFGILA